MLRFQTNANGFSDECTAAKQTGRFASAFTDVCVGRRGSGKPFPVKVHQVGGSLLR